MSFPYDNSNFYFQRNENEKMNSMQEQQNMMINKQLMAQKTILNQKMEKVFKDVVFVFKETNNIHLSKKDRNNIEFKNSYNKLTQIISEANDCYYYCLKEIQKEQYRIEMDTYFWTFLKTLKDKFQNEMAKQKVLSETINTQLQYFSETLQKPSKKPDIDYLEFDVEINFDQKQAQINKYVGDVAHNEIKIQEKIEEISKDPSKFQEKKNEKNEKPRKSKEKSNLNRSFN